MSAMPINAPEPDYGKCAQVEGAMAKIMELDPPNIDWMTGEFGANLLTSIHAGYTFIFMEMLKRGVDVEEAKESAQQQAPLLAFQLGMQVGADLEGARAMRQMWGDE